MDIYSKIEMRLGSIFVTSIAKKEEAVTA